MYTKYYIVNILPFDIEIAAVEFDIEIDDLLCEFENIVSSNKIKHEDIIYNNNQIGTKRIVSQLMLFHKQKSNLNNNYFHWQIDYGTNFGIPYHINYMNVNGATIQFNTDTSMTFKDTSPSQKQQTLTKKEKKKRRRK